MPRVVVDSKSIYSQSVTSRVSSPKSIYSQSVTSRVSSPKSIHSQSVTSGTLSPKSIYSQSVVSRTSVTHRTQPMRAEIISYLDHIRLSNDSDSEFNDRNLFNNFKVILRALRSEKSFQPNPQNPFFSIEQLLVAPSINIDDIYHSLGMESKVMSLGEVHKYPYRFKQRELEEFKYRLDTFYFDLKLKEFNKKISTLDTLTLDNLAFYLKTCSKETLRSLSFNLSKSEKESVVDIMSRSSVFILKEKKGSLSQNKTFKEINEIKLRLNKKRNVELMYLIRRIHKKYRSSTLQRIGV